MKKRIINAINGKNNRSKEQGLNTGGIRNLLYPFCDILETDSGTLKKCKRAQLQEYLQYCMDNIIDFDSKCENKSSDKIAKRIKGLEFGLCCKFQCEKITYKEITPTLIKRYSEEDRKSKISELCLHNCNSLLKSIEYCIDNNIGCFRVTSNFFPLASHPEHKYQISSLPDYSSMVKVLSKCKKYVTERKIRLIFHPGQFNILNSMKKEIYYTENNKKSTKLVPNCCIINNTVKELEHHNYVAELIGCDVINIHGGGGYGNKKLALQHLTKNISLLSDSLRDKLTLENDDRTFTVSDLLPVCRATGIKLLFDVHHHRCKNSGLSEEKAFNLSLSTWPPSVIPVVHISSPIDGWQGKRTRPHHDFIDKNDFPSMWLPKNLICDSLHIEVEAKGKELAVRKIMTEVNSML